MKWELYKATGIKAFFMKYLFWGHSDVLKDFKILVSKETNQSYKKQFDLIQYGLYYSGAYLGILCMYLVFILLRSSGLIPRRLRRLN